MRRITRNNDRQLQRSDQQCVSHSVGWRDGSVVTKGAGKHTARAVARSSGSYSPWSPWLESYFSRTRSPPKCLQVIVKYLNSFESIGAKTVLCYIDLMSDAVVINNEEIVYRHCKNYARLASVDVWLYSVVDWVYGTARRNCTTFDHNIDRRPSCHGLLHHTCTAPLWIIST